MPIADIHPYALKVKQSLNRKNGAAIFETYGYGVNTVALNNLDQLIQRAEDFHAGKFIPNMLTLFGKNSYDTGKDIPASTQYVKQTLA